MADETTQAGLSAVGGVVFDMDGTLTECNLDFDRIRAECGVPGGQSILEFMERVPESQREMAESVLHRHERRAARDCALRDGARRVLRKLRQRGMKLALLTRNSSRSVRTVTERFGLCFDATVSRDDAEPKPSPEPVLEIARRLGLEPNRLVVVGDYLFDMQAGRTAGARTAFMRVRDDLEPPPEADLTIDRLEELLDLLPETPEPRR
ncbi:MAG: HAD family hydrolase [Planctomycetota bacterium]